MIGFLPLDTAGRAAAKRHIIEGDRGRDIVRFTHSVPQFVLSLSNDLVIDRSPQTAGFSPAERQVA